MKYVLTIFFSLVVLFGAGAGGAVEKKSEAMIQSVVYQQENGVEVVRVKLNMAVDPTIFKLDGGNPRLVCDFPGTGYPQENPRIIAAGGKMIKRVRIGLHHTPALKTRIVIDLHESMHYSLAREMREQESILTIRVIPPVSAVQDEGEPVAQPREPQPEKGVAVPAEKPAAAPEENSESTAEEAAEMPATAADVPYGKEIDLLQEGAGETGGEEAGVTAGAAREIPMLLDVSFESGMNDKEMVLFQLSGFHPPVVFSTEADELLVVCDFLDAVPHTALRPVTETDGRYIEKIKITTLERPDKVRVVLELSNGNSYDLKQVFFKENNMFVIIISKHDKK